MSLPARPAPGRSDRSPSPARSLSAALLLAVLAVAASVSAQTDSGAASEGYRIGPRDVVEVRVAEAPEFNATDLRVNEEGKIILPVQGAVAIGGLTEAEAAATIERVLESHYVNRATVLLQIKEFRFRPITVIGAVGRPGPLAYSGRWTLLEVITAAGGLAGQHGDVVHILRRGQNGLSDQLTVSLNDLLVKGDPRVNVPILPSDLINVPGNVEVTIFCLGEVQKPGAVVFRSSERMTVLAAIARAGGLTDRAAKKVVIKREGEGGLVREIEVDYKAVLAGKIPDTELREGDVLFVKESFF